MKLIHGSCLCESVQFNVFAGSLNVYQCHCSVCRKVSGSSSSAAFFVKKESLTWVSGRELISVFKRESGYSSHFCTTCGSPVPHEFMEQYYWVPAGLLDAAAGQIAVHLHLGSKAHWEPVPNGGVQFAEAPELNALMQMVVCDANT